MQWRRDSDIMSLLAGLKVFGSGLKLTCYGNTESMVPIRISSFFVRASLQQNW